MERHSDLVLLMLIVGNALILSVSLPVLGILALIPAADVSTVALVAVGILVMFNVVHALGWVFFRSLEAWADREPRPRSARSIRRVARSRQRVARKADRIELRRIAEQNHQKAPRGAPSVQGGEESGNHYQ